MYNVDKEAEGSKKFNLHSLFMKNKKFFPENKINKALIITKIRSFFKGNFAKNCKCKHIYLALPLLLKSAAFLLFIFNVTVVKKVALTSDNLLILSSIEEWSLSG